MIGNHRLNISSYLICLIFLIKIIQFNCDQWNTEDFLKKEHSLSKPYGGSATIPNWDFVGSTIVTNKFIRLTSDVQSAQGALWNTMPVNIVDWEVQIHFHVHGRGKDLFGDGFSFWYTRDRYQAGPVFGSKDFFNGLGIFMDTYTNNNGPHSHPHPYISAMVNNGSLHYDNDKDGATTELAGCEAPFRNKDYDTYLAIRYFNYRLTVSTDIENKNTWKECFSVDKVRLPTGYYFGFSAATGDLSDNHDIISVKVYQLQSDRKNEDINTYVIEPSAATFSEPKDIPDDEKPSILWYTIKIIFITLLIISLIAIVIYVSYTVYTKQTRSKKRFY